MTAPRYTRGQLAAMARIALQHRAMASQPWLLLLLHLPVQTGIPPHVCVARIEQMAGWQ